VVWLTVVNATPGLRDWVMSVGTSPEVTYTVPETFFDAAHDVQDKHFHQAAIVARGTDY
jgi:hypothetical protein